MSDNTDAARPLLRVPTGVPGLDTILHGGLFRAGVYMVMGRPGAGKTILGTQIAFSHVAGGGRVLFVTLLTDSHDRMLANMATMEFFDESVLSHAINYVSAYRAFEAEGLPGVLKELRGLVKDYRATLVVIDGLAISDDDRELDMKKFLHEVQLIGELFGCTAMLLTGIREGEMHYAERTMVDGLIHLTIARPGMRAMREIEVQKHRGSPILMGTHVFRISNDGVTVFPRTESHLGGRAIESQPDARVTTGVTALDRMLGGGLLAASSTLLIGPPGSGKTLLGMQFLASAAKAGGKCLLLGFQEAPAVLAATAQATRIDLAKPMQRKALTIQWRAPAETLSDELAANLFAEIRARGIDHLFIDGLGFLADGLGDPSRMLRFIAALCNELRLLGVTMLAAEQTGADADTPLAQNNARAWTAFDNVIAFAAEPGRSGVTHKMSVLKSRSGERDTVARTFTAGVGGIRIAGGPRRAAKPKRARR